MRYLVSLLLFLLHPLGAFAGFTGSVVSVLDGDTIKVLHNQHPERIRLSGIDCPEKAKPSVTRPGRPRLHSSMESKSRYRPTARTSTGELAVFSSVQSSQPCDYETSTSGCSS